MVFDIKNKVALVTGGASGIGLEHVKDLLEKDVKGVTIADINLENGKRIVQELEKEFGPNRVIFVLTDVSNFTSFDNAFKVTIDTFKNIDILINNAGICRESESAKEIDINLKGTVNGMILGLEKYLRNYKQEDEAVIVNTASVAAVLDIPTIPIYSATKSAIVTLTKCWGQKLHHNRTKVRVLAICPGITDTPILPGFRKYHLNDDFFKLSKNTIEIFSPKMQSPKVVSKETMKLIEAAPNGSIWIIEESKPAYQYVFPSKNTFENNVLNKL